MTSSLPIKLNIESGNFKKSHVKKSLKVEQRYTSRLSDKTKAEVTEQVKQIRKALSSSRKGQRYWSLPFIHPTGGTVITSPFYIQRFYNMKPGSPHGGTDFRGRNGHPVQAINNGIVAFAADTFYAGKLIIIDHGDRFFSLYMHQSKLLVKKGERVMKGKVIGRIGSSGLVTGPHLHLGIIMHGIKIDPISLLLL
jgi:murein DD-endopeptidase MepM/ murein hydrolase activator NlpD